MDRDERGDRSGELGRGESLDGMWRDNDAIVHWKTEVSDFFQFVCFCTFLLYKATYCVWRSVIALCSIHAAELQR